MSKYILRKRTQGFIVISGNVINALKKKLPVLGFYNYLLNLPDNWHFYKTQICKDCAIGIKKLDKYLKELKALGLIDFGQQRDAHGKFSHFYLDVYDKEITNNTNENKDIKPSQPERQNCRTVKAVRPFGEAIQNTYIQNTKSIKRERGSLPKIFPKEFVANEKNVELANKYKLDIQYEIDKLRDWSISNDKKKTNWHATLNNWLRREHEYKERLTQLKKTTAAIGFRNVAEPKSTVKFFDDPDHPSNENKHIT